MKKVFLISLVMLGITTGKSNAQQSFSDTFHYTGASQIFVVPPGVNAVLIKAWGAQGGNGIAFWGQGFGGLGGYSTGKLLVNSGDTLQINVGGAGVQNGFGGFNGGGDLGLITAHLVGEPQMLEPAITR